MVTRYPTFIILLVVLCLRRTLTTQQGSDVKPSCEQSANICTFSFVVSYVYSMTWYDPGSHSARPVIIYQNGSAVYRDEPTCQTVVPMTPLQLEDVITADGTIRILMVVNNQLPGPPIVVYEGQEVVVNVTNDLLNEACTIHWHGQTQRGTPWMDGGGEVSQCAIQPGETFTYRFRADPVGTHWYHAHVGTQRTDGVYGPLIVLPKPKYDSELWGHGQLPHMDKEFSMMVQDWHHDSSLDLFMQYRTDLTFFGHPLGEISQKKCYEGTFNVDGFENGILPFESALINGKGRQYPLNSTEPLNPAIPIEIFHVERGDNYLFRVTSASMSQTFILSIDGHKLHVVATDGTDIMAEVVDMLIISPGERYDFYIEATDPDGTGNYWIRLETLEDTIYFSFEPLTVPGHVEAALRYAGGREGDPVSTRKKCSFLFPCKVLNCPYKYYPVEKHMQCIPLTDLRQRKPEKTLTPDKEYFLHFWFAMGRTSINGRSYLPPTAPPQTYPNQNYLKETCDKPDCSAACTCTHVLEVPLGSVVQMVFFVDGSKLPASTHPIHMHGHQYQVVKIGYPEYDRQTGKFLSKNNDIECLDDNCNKARWRDPSWRDGNIPGITEFQPVRKDTVSVPAGGYVIIRFRADNPGFWLMHCHMEFHNANGMALVIKEGNETDMAPLPSGFKTCGSFSWTEDEYRRRTAFQNPDDGLQKLPVMMMSQTGDGDDNTSESSRTAVTVLAVLSAMLLLLCAVLIIRLKQRNGVRSSLSERVKYEQLAN